MTESSLATFFERIYIINLASRQDRREEMQVELQKIGLSLSHPAVQLFAAVRPSVRGEWPSVGARGCFMSHLSVLKDAEAKGYRNILIFEDDVSFIKGFKDRIDVTLKALGMSRWDIFYGGYEAADRKYWILNNDPLNIIEPGVPLGTTHFVAFNRSVIEELRKYLDLMINRKCGDPKGGPMHVDGAYSWFRIENSKIVTIAAVPELGHQRSSRTDIHDLKWKDKIPILKSFVGVARKIRNFF